MMGGEESVCFVLFGFDFLRMMFDVCVKELNYANPQVLRFGITWCTI